MYYVCNSPAFNIANSLGISANQELQVAISRLASYVKFYIRNGGQFKHLMIKYVCYVLQRETLKYISSKLKHSTNANKMLIIC